MASNVSIEEAKALKELKRREGVIIKSSDKCQRFVVLDNEEYIQKSNDLLEDADGYLQIGRDPTAKIETEVKKALRGLRTYQ